MMQQRIFFQAIAILIVVLILVLAGADRRSAADVVKLNKIYTRTGDDGTTGLVDGSRVAKTTRGWPRSAMSTRRTARSAWRVAALDGAMRARR